MINRWCSFQIGDGDIDHAYWTRPEDMTMPRPAFYIDVELPGSDLAGETAAAMAATAIALSNFGEDALASDLLSHARDVFEFGDLYRGFYHDHMPSESYYR